MKKLRKIIFVIALIGILSMTLSVNSFAAITGTGTIYTDADGNKFEFTLSFVTGTVHIIGFEPAQPLADVVIPTDWGYDLDLSQFDIKIEEGAFETIDIKNVYIPENAIVESNAFSCCYKLETVYMYGTFADNNAGGMGSFQSCTNLKSVTLGDKVTKIPNHTFSYCESLEYINLNKVEEVGVKAFYDCDAITNIDGENLKTINERAFGKCKNLESVNFPLLKTVEMYGFSECSSLTSINFPVLEKIGDYAFSDCYSLKSINLYTVKELGFYAFRDCVSLKNCTNYNLTSVPNGLFYGCESLENFHQYTKITTIGSSAFLGCKNLSLFNLWDVTSIGSFAFSGCDKITEVRLRPKTSYGDGVFSDCINLKNITMQDNVSTLKVNDKNASFLSIFEGCENVETLYIGSNFNGKTYCATNKETRDDFADLSLHDFKNLKSVEISPDNKFFFMKDDVLYYENSSMLVLLCYMNNKTGEEFILTPDTDKEFVIAPYAFSDTKYLKKVIFPITFVFDDSIKLYYARTEHNMAEYAFLNSSVEEIVTPNGAFNTLPIGMFKDSQIKTIDLSNMTFVDKYTFSNCSNLTSVDIPLCTVIETGAFYGCMKLETVRIPRISTIKSGAFMNCQALKRINLSSAESVYGDAFAMCFNLEIIEFSEKLSNITDSRIPSSFAGCSKLRFYCDKDTYAYEYAIENHIPVVVFTVAFQNNAKFEYTGKEIRPSIIVALNDMALVENQDYILTYFDNIEIGKGLVKVQFIGDFEGFGDVERVFSIEPRNISNLSVEYVVDNEYVGEAVKPKVVVKNDDTVLTEGVDYTITYNSGTNTGSMFFTIKGKGNYTGSVDCYYNIIRRDIAEATVSKNNDMVYTGEGLTPKPIITWNGFTLQEDVDYEIRYFENVNAGYGTMVIYGMGNFCGTQRVQFRIFGKSLENAVISEIPDQTYTGSEITPDVTVTLDGIALTKNVDYTIKYENNTEKGVATVVISGIGNYSGVVKQTFIINKNSVYSFTVFSETEMTETYDGTELKPEMEVYFGTELLTEGVDYTISLENNRNAGTATVTIIGIGLYEGERSYNFTILPCEITENDISVSGNMEFNGVAVEPEISVYKNGIALIEGEDYTVTYSNNNAVGTALVTVEGIGNYCDTVNLQYEIYAPQQNVENKEENESQLPENTPDNQENTSNTDNKDNVNNQDNANNSQSNTSQNVTDNKENTEENTSPNNPVIPDTNINEFSNVYVIFLMISSVCIFAIIVLDTKKKIKK